jgi:hypothetical protein
VTFAHETEADRHDSEVEFGTSDQLASGNMWTSLASSSLFVRWCFSFRRK